MKCEMHPDIELICPGCKQAEVRATYETTTAQKKAARLNGKKGGRPRLAKTKAKARGGASRRGGKKV